MGERASAALGCPSGAGHPGPGRGDCAEPGSQGACRAKVRDLGPGHAGDPEEGDDGEAGNRAYQAGNHRDQAVLDSYGGLNAAYGRKEELDRNPELNLGDGVSITDYRAICSRRVQVLENGSRAEAEDEREETWRGEAV